MTNRIKLLNYLQKLSGVSDLLYSIFAIILALLIGAILIWISGYDVGKAYYNLFNGAFGNLYNFSQSLLKTMPLIFTGLWLNKSLTCSHDLQSLDLYSFMHP